MKHTVRIRDFTHRISRLVSLCYLYTILTQYSSDSQSTHLPSGAWAAEDRSSWEKSVVLLVLVAAAVVAASLSELLAVSIATWPAQEEDSGWVRTGSTYCSSIDPLPHQLLLSWFVPHLSSLVGQHPNEVTSLTMSCDSHMAYVTSRSWFLVLSLEAAFLGQPLDKSSSSSSSMRGV